jgi:outer membrane protein TolC
VRIREAQRAIARSQRLPSVDIATTWTRVAYPENGIPSGDFRPNWTVSANVSLPLFTGGRIRGDERVAQAELEASRARLDFTRELAAVDSRNALDRLDAARASLEASSGTVEQAERAYQIAELRFVEGIAAQLDVLDARLRLDQASANRARSARDFQVAQLRVALLPLLPVGPDQGDLVLPATSFTTDPGAIQLTPRTPETAPRGAHTGAPPSTRLGGGPDR